MQKTLLMLSGAMSLLAAGGCVSPLPARNCLPLPAPTSAWLMMPPPDSHRTLNELTGVYELNSKRPVSK
ncbi:Rz1 family lipoprotein [Candidatus Regiella insecticola]|uniref:Rz1 family lipoprotein n=1 Tax=Candidatus Regiella insecticola TaxID=138073 RepID=UPI001F29EF14|nr:Rz1 family lipoprotein [Candidatus Regiella insecticola]